MPQENQQPEKSLILTVGLPRSGKSTWSRKTGFPIVNPDSIRLALHGQPFAREAEPMVWIMAKYMVKSLFIAGHNNVVLDATNYGKKFRDEWWNPSQWTCKYKVFSTSKADCIKRAQETNMEYLIPIIEKMSDGFEPLTDIEKANEIGSDFFIMK